MDVAGLFLPCLKNQPVDRLNHLGAGGNLLDFFEGALFQQGLPRSQIFDTHLGPFAILPSL